jgi:ABC-type lipoprotein export system ATPase subunit
METIYQIKNLKCKYPTNEFPVLEIDNLDLNSGSRTFFIGASGVGKSTLLETLGLMNNTLHTENRDAKFIYKNGHTEDLIKIWDKKEKEIAAFRSKNLSFIFQNTNLFDTLWAFDNISISAILKGKSREEAVRATKEVIKKIIPNLSEDKPISQLSGGQRQRIAFARAIVNDFQVLFADEPTGNLDVANSRNLMNILMNSLEHRTSIIVTHDIELAVKYADRIVLINKKFIKAKSGKHYYGKINGEYTFTKSSENIWYSSKYNFEKEELFITFLKKMIIEQAG